MTIYREWAPTVHSRKGRMVSVEDLEKLMKLHDPGFTTVYAFDEDAAKEIKKSGSSSGFNKYSVIADTLIIDIDTGDSGLEDALCKLKSNGLACHVWSSGGKGYHLYIPHNKIKSIDLPYSHAKCVENLGIEADPTLYQHGRLISLPGRIHQKTKQKKKYLYSIKGDNLDLQIIEKPTPVFDFENNGGFSELAVALERVLKILEKEPKPGNRHTQLWGTSKDLADAGLSFDTVMDIMLKVNNSWHNQKNPEEIELAVSQAFKINTK